MVVFVLFQQVVHVKLMYDKESNRMRGKHVKTFEIHSSLLVFCVSPWLMPAAFIFYFNFIKVSLLNI